MARFARRLRALVRPRPTDEREALGVLYGLDGKVNIEIWPVEVVTVEQFDIQKLPDGHILEPWEVFEG